ncbi:alpha/beta fold hydrolase [Actinoplanes solisilvae]|uniref:alpha/beta fold hydrolase n=1 Tax=Actinoplanes solisilvae TaxID=2486853 RepID=UPI000FD8D692|nr:alpha/beta hydrolase [Actinoplanes solisilvae]
MNDTMLLIHGGGLADWFAPMADDPVLKDYRVIRSVRAGYTDTPVPPGLTVNDHAQHAAELIKAAPAHVVAHSSGSAVALQLALDHPDLIRTLVLVEPPLVDALADPADHDLLQSMFGPVIGEAMVAVARGDVPAAFDTFMTLVCGPDHRRVMLDALGPDVVEAAARRAYFFTDELPAIGAWNPPDLTRIETPVLLIQGSDSPPPLHRLITHLSGLIPGSTIVTIPGANHLMPLTRPTDLAREIDQFCGSFVSPSR